MTAQELETRRDMGKLNREWARDLNEACRLLEKLGAEEHEIDGIIGTVFVPSNVDEAWALGALATWHAAKAEDL